MEASELFSLRRAESLERISSLRGQLQKEIPAIKPCLTEPDVCIYATGSLARLEANPASDLDAFFFLTGSEKKKALGRIHDIKVLNIVLSASEKNGFPDFSNDGEYLRFLHIEDVLERIGGREDDYHNALTARMLLMLESSYLYNETLFDKFRLSVIERYFIDFHEHSSDFRPIFLLNDILRFWRTMCLNYEHNREWRSDDLEKRSKGHLANLKLRFSRLSICFSFIVKLLSLGATVSPEQVVEISRLTPLERIQSMSSLGPQEGVLVSTLQKEYAWFLSAVGHDKPKVLSWISDEATRIDAFAHSKVFIESMFRLVHGVSERHGYTRFLII